MPGEQPSADASAGKLGRRGRRTLVAAMAVAALALGITGWRIADDHRFVQQIYDLRLTNISNAVAEGTRLALGTLDDSLKTLAEIQSVQGGEISTDMLRLLRESTPGSLELFVLDPTGRIVATSTDESVAGVELGGSETHRWHLDHPGEGLYVSSPLLGFIGAGTGETLVRISRSWRDDHGRLGGIAVASFATERLRSYHSRLRLGDSGVISIFRNDGVLLTRQPAAPDTLGRSYVGTPLFDAAANTGSHGLFTTRFRSDGIQRRAAIRHVDGMPLLVSAGLAEDEILAPWRERTAVDLLLTALLLGLASVAGMHAWRNARAREDAAIATALRFERLAQGSTAMARSSSVGELLERVEHLCRQIVPARQVVASLTRPSGSTQPTHGSLAVPLVTRDGSELGLIELSNRQHGEFDELDEALVNQLAQLAATAIEKLRLFDATHDAEQRYRRIVEGTHEGIWLVSPEGLTEFVNARMAEMLGRTTAQMTGTAVAEHLMAGSSNPLGKPSDDWHRAMADDGDPVTIEMAFRHLDGRRVDTLVTVSRLVNARGQLTGLLGMVSDLSDRRAAEAEAIRARQEVETILGSISDGFYALDDDWRFRYVNAEGERMLQQSRDTLIGRSIWERFPETASGEIGQRYRAARESGRADRFEVWYRELERWFEIRVYPHGSGLAVYFLDITQRIDTERLASEHQRELEESLARYERLRAQSLDIICTIDTEGRFTDVSARARKIWGYEPADLTGRRYIDLVHPDDRSRTLAAARRVYDGEPVADFENRYLCSDGRIARMLWACVWSPADQQMFAIARDITDRVELEERVRQSQKMEAIGQLTGGVAHDFNNLLTVILGNADELVDALDDDPARRQLAEATLSAAERAAQLTSRLLSFARRQPLNPEPLDLNRRLADLDALLRRTLGERIAIELVRGAGLWLANADASQLDSAIINLAVNARDAMPDGGRLTMETANVALDDLYVRDNRDIEPGQYVCIAISDNGTGMPPEVAARVFEPFFTTKPAGSGSGLGLSMVYGFARQSGGHVKLYTEAGRGTTVRLYLPRAHAKAPPAPTRDTAPPPGGSETICLVEDDELVRRFTEATLRELGYRVTAFGNAEDALAALDNGLETDLLLTDVVLPGTMNGPQLARAVQALRPRLKVLFVSGYTQNAIVHHGRLDPGVELLSKPFRRADLAARLRRILD